MTAPPGLVATALLFWGWQAGFLAIAAVIAIVLEGSRLVPWRWDLSATDEGRISDVSTIAFMTVSIYLALKAGAPILVFVWLPFALVLLMVAQVYSRAGTIAVSAMLWMRRAQRKDGWPRTSVDLSYVYVALCIAGASAANGRTPFFYVGMLVLSGWALWSVRARALPRPVWAGALALAALLGYGGHLALSALQPIVEEAGARWLYGTPSEADPYVSATAIGRIGRLKMSGRVAMRVRPGEGVTVPVLLRDASYDTYRATTWMAGRSPFTVVDPGPDPGTWVLAPAGHRGRQVSVSTRARDTGILALPVGAFRVDGLQAANLRRNRLGTVLVDGAPGLDEYRVSFHPDAAIDAPPTAADLAVPAGEAAILADLAPELNLPGRPSAEVLQVVRAFFRDRFRYTSYVSADARDEGALADFLRRTRAGHCEYFATATVLMLRTAGVPARYVTGHLVQEWSALERQYVVRARHAHAWTLAHVDGAWRALDTTPAMWVGAEREEASIWEPITDIWSWGAFKLSRWWAGETRASGLWAIAALLLGAVAWKFFPRPASFRLRKRAPTPPAGERPARSDSEFYAIEQALAGVGLGRHPSEPVPMWLRRVEAAHPAAPRLHAIGELHCRHRFDPIGLTAEERAALRSSATAWLAEWQSSPARRLTRSSGTPPDP